MDHKLGYLFLNIGVGLGFGADQRIITATTVLTICSFLTFRNFFHKKELYENIYISVKMDKKDKMNRIEQIITVLKKHCARTHLKHFDDLENNFDATFLIEFKKNVKIQEIASDLRELSSSAIVNFIDATRE